MGKRNYGNGIIDRRYRSDGSRTGYGGDLPFRVYCHYRDEQYSRCFATYREAEDWKRDQDEQDRNRDNIGYINRKETEKLRGIKVSDVIYRAMKRIGEGMGDTFTLLQFAQSRLGQMSLFDVNGRTDLFKKYFEERSKSTFRREGWSKAKQVKATTVYKEYALIRAAFNLAITDGWFDGACRH